MSNWMMWMKKIMKALDFLIQEKEKRRRRRKDMMAQVSSTNQRII
jgi:hypothetical protein